MSASDIRQCNRFSQSFINAILSHCSGAINISGGGDVTITDILREELEGGISKRKKNEAEVGKYS